MLLSEYVQEVSTVITPEGLLTPGRVPPGVLIAAGYFQATTGDVLQGYIDNRYICEGG